MSSTPSTPSSSARSAEAADEAFELDSAYQGEEAIEKVRRARALGEGYALLFIDVRMPPGLDGIQTTARLLRAGLRGRHRHLLCVLRPQLGGDDRGIREDRSRADSQEAVRYGRSAAARARAAAALGARAPRFDQGPRSDGVDRRSDGRAQGRERSAQARSFVARGGAAAPR